MSLNLKKGPSQQSIWVPYGFHMGTHMGPIWAAYKGPASDVKPGFTWVPYGLAKIGPIWVLYGSYLGLPIQFYHFDFSFFNLFLFIHCNFKSPLRFNWCRGANVASFHQPSLVFGRVNCTQELIKGTSLLEKSIWGNIQLDTFYNGLVLLTESNVSFVIILESTETSYIYNIC